MQLPVQIPAACPAEDVNSTQGVLSALDVFNIGIGPSSSHTVGPMRAAADFRARLLSTQAAAPNAGATKTGDTMAVVADGLGPNAATPQAGAPAMPASPSAVDPAPAPPVPARIQVELFGSLAATGRGHGTDRAVILGLCGYRPSTVSAAEISAVGAQMEGGLVDLLWPGATLHFTVERDLSFAPALRPTFHVNALRLAAFAPGQAEPYFAQVYYSTGGGFVLRQLDPASELDAPTNFEPVSSPSTSSPSSQTSAAGGHVGPAPAANRPAGEAQAAPSAPVLPHPYRNLRDLVTCAENSGRELAEIIWENEGAWREAEQTRAGALKIIEAMRQCVLSGLEAEGTLPGGLKLARRAKALRANLLQRDGRPAAGQAWAASESDPLRAMDWVNLWALAVSEENAAGSRVVTAPTNGAAGVIPAVLGYLERFCPEAAGDNFAPVAVDFLLVAGAIGAIIKTNASIAGAEVGCQGEVGSACAMAAGGLAAALGGSPAQIENAAEIAMEHSLGLTCDPIGGLVQIPCIERNAIGAIKAINAARMALWGDGHHRVSFDEVVETMKQTGADMHSKYKETAAGGLAVNVVEC